MDLGPPIAVAAVVAFFGPAILLLALGTPLRGPPLVRGYLELAMAIALPSMAVGVLAQLLASNWTIATSRPGATAAAVAGFTLLILTYLRFRPLSLVRSSIARLGDPSQQTDAVARLITGLERLKPKVKDDQQYRGSYPDIVLGASTHLIAYGLFRAAEQICARLPEAWLSQAQSAQRANNLAVCRMRLGDVSGARHALEASRGQNTRQEQEILRSSRAMLLLMEGKFREALELVGSPNTPATLTRMTVLVVRAHAHAALGELDDARRAIDEIFDLQGPGGLEALIHPVGPATEMAREAQRKSAGGGGTA